MKDKVYYFVVLIILIIGVFVYLLYNNRTNTRIRGALLHEIERIKSENSMLQEGFFHSYDFADIPVDLSAHVFNSNGDTLILKDLFSGRNNLVVFMSVGSCSCVYDNVKIINNIKQKSNITVCIDGLSEKEFKSFVTQNNIKDISYCMPTHFYDGLTINPVVYFVVDKALNAKFFYAASPSLPGLTKIYLDKVNTMTDFELF